MIENYRRQIEAALEYAGGTHTFEDVAAAVDAGAMQLWTGPNSVVVTEILQFPRYKALNFFLAGGNMAELEAMHGGIIEWAREQGCERALFTGRKGWERTFLTRTGWTNSELVVLEKVL